MSLQHVIMTRFNLATPGKEATLRNNAGWLEGRFELFERYCLPTLAAQDSQDFRWIIYFDVETPASIRERIKACQKVRAFEAYFTGLFPSEGWRNSVRELLGADAPEMLLTTNLDNDDGLAVDFVSRLHKHAREHQGRAPCALNFTDGYVLNQSRLFAHAHKSNAFVNLLEPMNDGIRTAPAIRHMDLAQHVPVIQLPGPGAWLQVVHGGNVSNKVRGRRVGVGTAEERFPRAVIADVRDPTAAEMLGETLVAAPLRTARDLLVKAVRSVRR